MGTSPWDIYNKQPSDIEGGYISRKSSLDLQDTEVKGLSLQGPGIPETLILLVNGLLVLFAFGLALLLFMLLFSFSLYLNKNTNAMALYIGNKTFFLIRGS